MGELVPFWRKEAPVLREDHSIEIGGMWDHQRLWWNSAKFIKALVAGYGSGKSFIAAKKAISLCLVNRGAPHLWIAPTYKVARKTIEPLLENLLEGKKTLDNTLSYKHNRNNHAFTIRHRGRVGQIWIASGDNPDSLKGPNIGSATIDEPFIQEKEVFDQCIARVRDPRAKYKEIGLVGTPEQLNWGYEICEGEDAHRYSIEVFHAHTKENLALGPEYYQRLEAAFDDKAGQAYVGGLFVNLGKGIVYYAFDRFRNVAELPDPGGELEVGMDFNVNPMAAVVFWRNGPHVHVMEELELDNADTEYMCSVLTEKFVYESGPLQGQCRIKNVYPDASGKSRHTNAPGGRSDFSYIEAAGLEYFCNADNPKIRDRENAVNAKLKPHKGIAPTLTISPKCRKLRKYLQTYTHENRGTPEGRAMSHLLDALGYPIAYLYPIHKPVLQSIRFIGH